jgi:Helix-turn-helix domain
LCPSGYKTVNSLRFDAQGLQIRFLILCLTGYNIRIIWHFDALGLQMTTLVDVADMLKEARREAELSQAELARRAAVARTTVARMETLAKGDMSVSALVRLLEAAGYDLKAVKHGHTRTLEDILAEQREGASTP